MSSPNILPLNFVLLFGLVLLGSIGSGNSEDQLSAKDKDAVKKFYPMVKDGFTKDIQHDERYLIRWIRAKNYDLKGAEELLRKNFEWRKAYKMDNILNEDFADWERNYPFNFLTHDREGRPAISSGLGRIDVRKIVVSGQKDKLDRYIIYGYESGLYNFHGQNFTDGYLLFNVAGYTARSHACVSCIPTWILLIQNYEKYYPGLVRGIYAINTPRAFHNLINILKPFVTSITTQEIRIFGVDREEFSRELLKTFSADQLLPEYGGTLKPSKSKTIKPN